MRTLFTLAALALSLAGANATNFPFIRLNGKTNIVSDNGTNLTYNGSALSGGAPTFQQITNAVAAPNDTNQFWNGAGGWGKASANWLPSGTTNSTLAGTATVDQAVATNHLAAPATPTVTPTGTSGAATWTYKVSALLPNGLITILSSAGSTATGNATLDATNYNALAWTAYPTAISYFVYRTAVGGTPNTTGLLAAVNTNSYNDVGLPSETNVNIPTTALGLITSGALRLGEYPDEQEVRLGVEGDADVHGSIRSTGVDNLRTGSGTELQYVDGIGDVFVFDRDHGTNQPLALNYSGNGTNGPVLINTRYLDGGNNALQVHGNVRFSGGLALGVGFTTVPGGYSISATDGIITESGGNTVIAQRAVGFHYWENLGIGQPAEWYMSNASSPDTMAFHVSPDGKFGILTNAPAQALTVSGNIQAGSGFVFMIGTNTLSISGTNIIVNGVTR